MTEHVIGTLVLGFVAALVVQAVTVYAVVHVMLTGRGVIRRREVDEDDRVVAMTRGRS